MIRKATADDVLKVADSYKELKLYEKENVSFTNWALDGYPNLETAEKSFKNGTLFVLEENGELCASVILNHIQPCEHYKIMWKYDASDLETLTIHTLCVPPSKAGKGYGKKMVKFILDYAGTAGCKTVRLDTYEGNIPAQRFYEKLGFEYSGKALVDFEGIRKVLKYYEYKL